MKILVCRHVPQEGMGYLEKVFSQCGVEFEYQDLYEDATPRLLTDYQGLVVMGGPMNVDQVKEYPLLRTDYKYLEEALAVGMPVLGFCLGGQLIARVLGAKITRNPQPELGWYDLELAVIDEPSIFNGFPAQCKVFQWHQDTFEIPEGAVFLASTKSCRNQAFRWGDNVFGLQFHLEVTEEMVHDWLIDSETIVNWGFEAEPIRQETKIYIQKALELGSLLGKNFVKLL